MYWNPILLGIAHFKKPPYPSTDKLRLWWHVFSLWRGPNGLKHDACEICWGCQYCECQLSVVASPQHNIPQLMSALLLATTADPAHISVIPSSIFCWGLLENGEAIIPKVYLGGIPNIPIYISLLHRPGKRTSAELKWLKWDCCPVTFFLATSSVPNALRASQHSLNGSLGGDIAWISGKTK